MFPFGFPGGAVPGNYYPVGPSRPTPPPNAISFPSSGPPPLGMPPVMGQPHGIMNMGSIPPPIPFHMGGGGGFAVPTTPYIAPTRLNVPHNNPPMVMPMPMPMPMPMAMPMPQPPSFVPPLPGSPPSDVPPPPPPPPTPPPPSSPPTESCPPPPKMPGDSEMMRNIEKLAAFVVTNGPQFESMVRAKQFGDPKFAFLFETDLSTEAGIGHEYYKWKKMSLELQKQAENRDSKPGEERSLSKQSQQVVHSSFDPGEASPTASDIDMEDDFASPLPSRESSEPSADSGEAVAAEEEINSKQHGDDISDRENEHVSRVSMSPVSAPNRETSPDISKGEEKLGTLLSVAEKGQELQEGSGLARRKSSPHTDLDPLAKEGGEFAMESVSSEDEQAEEQRVKEGRDSTLAQEEDAEKNSTGDETSSSPSQQSPPFTLSESPAPSPAPSKQSPASEYHHDNQSRLLLGEESQPRLPGALPSFNPNVGSGGPSFSVDTSKQFTFPNFSQNGGVPSSRQPGLGFSMDHPSSSSSSLSRPWMAPNTWAQTGVVQPSSFSYSGGMEFPPRHMSDGVSLATGKPYDPLSDSLEPEPEPEPGPWRNVMANDSNFRQGDVSTPENDGARLLAKVLQSISPPVDAPSIWRPLGSVAEMTTHFGSRKMELGITIPVEKGSSQGEKKSSREPKEGKAKAKKSKEARGLKLLRAAAADRVKELLKPAWKQGQIGKEAFKTITKKSVDKVTGTLKSHQIPKTQEKVAQYLASSKEKIGKLVQSYVDKYTKR